MAVNSFNAQNPPVNTKGDLFTFSTIPTKLGVGTNGQYLSADSTTATGLKWASVSAGANWSLLNTGGTALTGATTVTVSGISGVDKIMILVQGASAGSGDRIEVRFNSDTGSNYGYFGSKIDGLSTYAASIFSIVGETASTSIPLAKQASNTNSTVSGYLQVTGCNASGRKVFTSHGGRILGSATTGGEIYTLGGYYAGTSTISSISIVSDGSNLDAGTVYVYTSA